MRFQKLARKYSAINNLTGTEIWRYPGLFQ